MGAILGTIYDDQKDDIPSVIDVACQELNDRSIKLDPKCSVRGLPSHAGAQFVDMRVTTDSPRFGTRSTYMVWEEAGAPIGICLGVDAINFRNAG